MTRSSRPSPTVPTPSPGRSVPPSPSPSLRGRDGRWGRDGSSPEVERDGSRGEVATGAVTPVSVLRGSHFGSLTRGGLRDAFAYTTGCKVEDALLVIDVYLESGIIVEGEDGLLRVRQ